MKKQKFNYLIIFLFIIFFSCKKNNKSLQIIFLNDTLTSFGGQRPELDIYSREYAEKSQNIIRFKIINSTQHNYMFININKISFPYKNYQVDFDNLIIKDASGNIAKKHFTSTSKRIGFENVFYDEPALDSLRYMCDKEVIGNFIKNGYKDSIWIRKSLYVQEYLIFLPAGETKYFETHVNLPYNFIPYSFYEAITLDRNKKYSAYLQFVSDTTNINEYLPWDIKQTIKENNYVFYTDTLRSNWVPIKFVE